MRKEKKHVILFDLDGTLIDSTEAILESFEAAYSHFGESCPAPEKITAEIGHPLDGMFVSLGIPEASIEGHVAAYKVHYRKISRAKTLLLPDAERAIRDASVAARLGVVTTKTAKYSIELLEHLKLINYFEVVIGREDVIYPKPHPEPVLKALSKLQAGTKNSWMIGDTCMDMQAAQAAGIKGVAVTYGYGSREQLSKCSSLLRESARDAVDLIVGN